MTRLLDVVGQRFGRLLVLRREGEAPPFRYRAVCACDCGQEWRGAVGDLRAGHARSCGCIKRELFLARRPALEKACRDCRLVKPLAEFYNDRAAPTRKTYQCKACLIAYRREIAPRAAKWFKEYYKKNKTHHSAMGKAYRIAHADELRAFRQTPAYKAKKSAWDRQYYERHTLALRERSRENAIANPEMYRAYKAAYKAKKRAAFVEFVDVRVVYERDMGLCRICGLPVGPGEFHLDHRMPLSRGGAHSLENCQTAHAICNIRKQDKLPGQYAHLWMRN